MQIELIKINELVPYDKNPRINKNAVDAVANSMREFGVKTPLIIDDNNVLVCGHTRLKAAKKLKLKELPCVRASDLSEEKLKAYRIADNSSAALAEWDLDLLAVEVGEISLDMTQFGLEPLQGVEELPEVVEDEAPEVDESKPPVSQLGDIWSLGKHRLMCGDSTDAGSVALLMGGVKADMFLSDPPYNVNYEGKTKDALKIENDKMSNDNFRDFLKKAFESADFVMKKGAVFYIWHADSEGYNFRGACADVLWTVRQCLIWVKNSLVMGRQDYHWKHEPCLYGWKEGASHLWASDRKQTTVIEYQRPNRNAEHPTMKPVGLFDYQIKNNTKQEDVVLDLFMGSGTTIIACEQNGRIAYGMELDPKYMDVILKRYQNLTGIEPVLVSTDYPRKLSEVQHERQA